MYNLLDAAAVAWLPLFICYANANCPFLSKYVIGAGSLFPSLRYPQFASTSFFAMIGTTLFPILATWALFGYGLHK